MLREDIQKRVIASGPTISSDEAWTRDAFAAMASIGKSIKEAGQSSLSDVKCYHAGCIATGTFDSSASFTVRRQKMRQDLSERWRGPAILTAPEVHSDGTVTNVWFLENPQS